MEPPPPTLLPQPLSDKYTAACTCFLDRTARYPDRLRALFTSPGAEGETAGTSATKLLQMNPGRYYPPYPDSPPYTGQCR